MTVYRQAETDLVYERGDLRDRYSVEQTAALVRSARALNSSLHGTDIEEAPLGRPGADER